jgi:hypothetical protein
MFREQIISTGAYLVSNPSIADYVFFLGYSHEFENLSVGANVRYYYQRITGYDSLNGFTLNVGAIWQQRMLTHGLSFSNLTNTRIREISLPSLFKYEIKLTPLENTSFALAFESELGYKERIAFAVLQNITEALTITTGFISNPGQFSAGVSISISNIHVSYGVRTHNPLGNTHALGIKYLF